MRWKNSPEEGDAGAEMTVLYRFPVKGLGNAALSYPLSCSTLVLGDQSLAAVTPCTHRGAGVRRGFRHQSARQASGAPQGHYSGRGCALSLGNRTLGRGQQVGSGRRRVRRRGWGWGGDQIFAWRAEVVPSCPRQSGGGLTGGGSSLSLALSLCLPIRILL